MMFTLRSAAAYMRGLPVRGLVRLLQASRLIFTFTHERANRLRRYVVIVNDYKRGKPVRDIEAQHGCSRNTVMRYARSAGLEKRQRGFDPALRAEVIALYKAEMPIAEIANRTGVSEAYVSKTATEEGINRRTFKPERRKQRERMT